MRILAISDLHVDKPQNFAWVEQLSQWDYKNDVLLVAGDISDVLSRLESTFELLACRFNQVFYVPGNHELWLRENQFSHSLEKWETIEWLCQQYGITTRPALIGENAAQPVWIVPLFSWYLKPEDGEGSLFLPKPGEDPSLAMWADNYHIKWPASMSPREVALSFLQRNETHFQPTHTYPIITFSHFLPRQELIFPDSFDPQETAKHDRFPAFNFSRVAGCWQLDAQLRKLGAHIHVYGHQHRNRDRTIDGVRYISYCLGYPEERRHFGLDIHSPMIIWDTEASESFTSSAMQ